MFNKIKAFFTQSRSNKSLLDGERHFKENNNVPKEEYGWLLEKYLDKSIQLPVEAKTKPWFLGILENESYREYMNRVLRCKETYNHELGLASICKHGSKLATKEGLFDDAWRLEHSRQMAYARHGVKCKWTGQMIHNLCATVDIDRARITTKEKKFKHALLFYSRYYCISTQKNKNDKKQLQIYFDRARKKYNYNIDFESFEEHLCDITTKFKNTTDIVDQFILSLGSKDD